MLRYTIPFKDNQNRPYEVRIYKDGYSGKAEELRGAVSAFTVEGDDEDYVYTPVRLSSATLTLLDVRVMDELYSQNRQSVPVKLYQGSSLVWTGYASPEQFTQPYRPNPDYISIDCMSAMASLEDAQYVRQTEDGLIAMSALLRHLIASAKGGYDKVYIPHVYASSKAAYDAGTWVLDDITVSEANFTTGEMTLDEVLEYVCTFFAWTMYDYEGSLYFVDPDWAGDYRAYNEGLTSFAVVQPNAVNLQQVGFAGSDHTIDILPGYNKCSVKSINNVFEEPVTNEDYDELDILQEYKTTKPDNKHVWKKFLGSKKWKTWQFDRSLLPLQNFPDGLLGTINDTAYGAVLMKEASFEAEDKGGGLVVKNSADVPWVDCVHLRGVDTGGNVVISPDKGKQLAVLQYTGEPAIWKDGALCISYATQARTVPSMDPGRENGLTEARYNSLTFSLRVGQSWYNGAGWQSARCQFVVPADKEGSAKEADWVQCENNKTVDMPYKGLRGYIIELPKDRVIVGDVELTLYSPGGVKLFDSNKLVIYGVVIKDLKLSYRKRDDANDDGENGDRVYENVVNGSFLSDADEVEFGIGSYNADGATYSKALMAGKFLTDNLYSAVEDKTVRPEEAYIRRVVKRYKTTHVKLTQVAKNSLDIHPFTVLSDKSMVSKKFMAQTWIRDYERNTLTLSMIDNG